MTDIIVRPSFEQMVSDLFKQMPGHGATMLHAAVGIAGESGELRAADNRANMLEEAGDMEFYITAAWLQIVTPNDKALLAAEVSDSFIVQNVTLGNVVDRIHCVACEILDFAKKVWVYGEGSRDINIKRELVKLEYLMARMYELLGTTQEEIRRINQDKLLGNEKIRGRYATGKYSDEQAQARVDKIGSERNFIGKE